MTWTRKDIARGALALLGMLSLPAAAGLFSGPDPDWKEGEVVFPPPPREESLMRFSAGNVSRNEFLIDEDSLAVGEDGIVRYVLVVRAAGGARNVTFEGIRCETGSWQLYASGRSDGHWAAAREPRWQPIAHAAYNGARGVLATEFFCDAATAPRNRDEVLRRLRGLQRAERYHGH